MPDIYIAKNSTSKKTPNSVKTPFSSPKPPLPPASPSPSDNTTASSSPSTVPLQKLQLDIAKEISQVVDPADPQPTRNPLASFAFFPDKVNFETQAQEENIVLLLRRHPITNVPWIILAILLLIAPTFLRFLPLPDIFPPTLVTISIMIWYLVTLAFIFENFLSWYFNINILTDERVIDFDFLNLVYKDIADAKIEDIQETKVVVGGVIRTLLNFGSVYIQTAAERPNFEFIDVPNPEQVAKVIDKLRLDEEQEGLVGHHL